MWRNSSRVLLALALVCLWALPVYSQSQESETQDSEALLRISRPLWDQLYSIAETLPNQYDLFVKNLLIKIDLLQSNNQDLTDSNASLKRNNEDLATSQKKSKIQEAILEGKSESLQKALDDSMRSTTQALNKIKFQSIELWIWRGTTVAGIIGILILAASR